MFGMAKSKRNFGKTRPHLLIVVNVDWFFLSHRLALAVAAKAAGYKVTIAAADTGHSDRIKAKGLGFVALPFSRSGTKVISELRSMASLWHLYRQLKPDLIHHVTIKPVLYGSIVARALGSIPVANAISGLGYMFSDGEEALRLRGVTQALYRAAFRHKRSKVIFQNPDDVSALKKLNIVRDDQIVLIRGSGVDPELFIPSSEPGGVPVVVLASRLLWDKGVGVFVEAVRELRAQGMKARFVLVGDSDDGNPTAVPREQLQAWHTEGVVEWWGYRTDMVRVFAEASIVALPTFYPEGLPKVLLEAAACGRPIVATDVPGCREIVRDGKNGILVQPKDSSALADAIKRLLVDRKLRSMYGQRGREIVVGEFSLEFVTKQHLEVYSDLINSQL